jgi:hypothetical protein
VLTISPVGSSTAYRGSSLLSGASSAISPTFIARLIKGCRVDVRAGYLGFEKI